MSVSVFEPGMGQDESELARHNEYAGFVDYRNGLDRDFLASIPSRIEDENQEIRTQIDAGKVFVVNGPHHLVHTVDCTHVAHQFDREAQWRERAQAQVDGAHYSLGGPSGRVGRMPRLMSRVELESLTRYSTCAHCGPDVTHRVKNSVGSGRRVGRVGAFNAGHIGRQIESTDGEPLGHVVRVVQIHDSAGSRSIISTTTSDLEVDAEYKIWIVERKFAT